MKTCKLLDCTLRDGSYVLDFQFTEGDTRAIAEALDSTGFRYIEVGHGLGLGATERTNHVAAASDTEYMQAASQAVQIGKWGMFCIPGIAELDHLRIAVDYGMDFVRIGTDVDKIDQSQPFIELARKLGIQVFSNFMKSYVLDPEAFAKLAARAIGFGSELVYLVDSAGGMLPNEVQAFIEAVQAEDSSIALGFHGHNNLGLAVANSLICVDKGVELIDASLQGFGRSAGNTPTEQLLSAASRAGFAIEVDPISSMELGETFIRPFIEQRGLSSLDIVSGFALFHSSYMPTVLNCAKRNRVDPRKLIVEICKIDKVNLDKQVVEELAISLKATHSAPRVLPWGRYFGEEQT